MAPGKINDARAEEGISAIRSLSAPTGAPAIIEDLRTGGRILGRAFAQSPVGVAGHDTALIRLGERDAPIILLRSGFAYKSCVLADGRRAILDLLVPGDMIGLDHIILASAVEEITAANRVGLSRVAAVGNARGDDRSLRGAARICADR